MPNRKRKNQGHETAVYDPNGGAVPPGHGGFPRTRADNGSHVYATIDETLIYTHLLGDGERGTHPAATESEEARIPKDAESEEMAIGVYHPFRAPPLPDRPRSRALVDNDIYQTGMD